ncbi:MAG: DNA polymerase I [Candidatus Obscuribacterales bacterium]|nr:DNA polymerase I [Candidatus Obscuribacterales bacterium]
MSEENNTLYLVDGSSLAFRSFFALFTTGMRNSQGTPTWAIYGFFSSLFDLIEKRSPHSLAVCFDRAEPTFRHEEFVDYKANRDEMPDDLAVQWPLIKEGIEALSIPVYELAGYEADDLIGTAAKMARTRQLNTVILTGDQDAFQLLDEHIQVLMPTKEGLKTYGRQEVFDKLGIWPEQVIDYKGLCGDTSDNIPGVRGIGPKTAAQLLTQFGNLDAIYERTNEIKSASVRQKLTDGRQSAFDSRGLATIRLDVPFQFDFDHCQLTLPEIETAAKFFRDFEFRALLKRLPKVLARFNNGVEPEVDPGLFELTPRAKKTITAPVAAEANNVQLFEPQILRTAQEIDALVEELGRQEIIALELKANNSLSLEADLVGVALAWSNSIGVEDGNPKLVSAFVPGKCVYIPLLRAGEAPVSKEGVLAKLKPILESKTVKKTIFDSKFAANVCSLFDIDLQGIVFDPMLASYIVNPDDKHKLQLQSERLLGKALRDSSLLTGTGKRAIAIELIPLKELASVACEEVQTTLELTAYYLTTLDLEQQDLLWTMDLPVASALAHMEQNGITLDLPYFSILQSELSSEISRLEKEIYELAGHPFNIGSPLQLQKILFEELKLPTKSKTKSGYSTDASVLEALKDSHQIIPKILEYRHVFKLNSTYVDALPKQISARDGKLHGEFNQTVAATGRLSSTNPNLQNIPIRTELGRRIRRGFIPSRTENFIMSADYSQIELRMLAHMSGDENLIAAFQSDQDIHLRTAMLIFDLAADAIDHAHRGVGKTLNFALIYQQGAFSTAQALGISMKEAQTFIEKYFTSFPKVRSFMNRVLEDARANGYVQTLWGRKRYFQHLNDRNDGIRKANERAAFNAPLQGGAADLMKLAMIRLDNELAQRKMRSKLILQVHDELVLDVPEAEIEQAREVLVWAMSMDQPLTVPLKVDVGVAKNWMEAK